MIDFSTSNSPSAGLVSTGAAVVAVASAGAANNFGPTIPPTTEAMVPIAS